MDDPAETEQLTKSVMDLERQLSESRAEEAWLREKAEEFRQSVLLMVTNRDLSIVPEFTLGKRPVAWGEIGKISDSVSDTGESAVQLKNREAELKRKLKDSRNRYTELKVSVDNFRTSIVTLVCEGHGQEDNPKAIMGQEDTERSQARVSVPAAPVVDLNASDPGSSSSQRRTTAPKDQRVKFQCELCKIACSSTFSLKRHRTKVHKIKNSSAFYCLDCGERFQNRSYLIYHRREKHAGVKPSNKFQCDLCNWRFARPTELKSHQAAVHKIGNSSYIYCCGARFGSRKELRKHRREKQLDTTTGRKRKKIPKKSRVGLQDDRGKLSANHGIRVTNRSMRQRGTEFHENASNSGNPAEHKVVNDHSLRLASTLSRRRSCRSGAGFRKKKVLPLPSPTQSFCEDSDDDVDSGLVSELATPTKHIVSSTSDDPASEECDQGKPDEGSEKGYAEDRSRAMAPVQVNAAKHHVPMKRNQRKSPVQFQCDLCNVVFSRAGNLRRHRANVHNRMNFCSDCNRSFRTRAALRIHRSKNHTHINKRKCIKIIKTHDDEENPSTEHGIRGPDPRKSLADYLCLCGALYKKRSSFLSHVYIAKRGRIFKCHKCPYRANLKHSLNEHVRKIHPDKIMTTLKKHQPIMHGIRDPDPRQEFADYFCLCGDRFTRRKAILLHIQLDNRFKVYKCQSCSFRTTFYYMFKKHERNHRKSQF